MNILEQIGDTLGLPAPIWVGSFQGRRAKSILRQHGITPSWLSGRAHIFSATQSFTVPREQYHAALEILRQYGIDVRGA